MPRKAHSPAEIHAEPGPIPAGHALTLAEEQETKDLEREAAFEAAKTIGQIEALLFSATVAEKAIVETFLKLKENKAYRSIQFRDTDGNLRRVADLGEFCERFLKKSYRRVQEMASNYHLIGADLYETAEQIGFRQKDYTALKALPADDQAIIKQAIAADDRDQVIDLLQEMAARHASEKAALQAEATEAKDTAEARDQVVRKKEQRLNELEEENHKLKRRVQTTTPDEEALEVRNEADRIAFEAEHAVSANLRKAFDHLAEFGGQHSEFMLGLITQIELACDVLRADFGLLKAGPDGDSTPVWERAGAGQG
ncbi:MAG: hypothetical protein M0Z99_22480 [Betaproteobacteria bacterium]|nr:hypothetical protein [Betaproteobacteria bacterium]